MALAVKAFMACEKLFTLYDWCLLLLGVVEALEDPGALSMKNGFTCRLLAEAGALWEPPALADGVAVVLSGLGDGLAQIGLLGSVSWVNW